jgi:hypothetical protein
LLLSMVRVADGRIKIDNRDDSLYSPAPAY